MFLYYIVPFLQILTITLIETPWIVLWSIYVVIPILDEVLPLDYKTPKLTKELENNIAYKLPLYLVVVLDWCLMFVVLNHLTFNTVSLFDVYIKHLNLENWTSFDMGWTFIR